MRVSKETKRQNVGARPAPDLVDAFQICSKFEPREDVVSLPPVASLNW